jgi:hypothetical protein
MVPKILLGISSFEFEENSSNGTGAENKPQSAEHGLYISSSVLLLKECSKTIHIRLVRTAWSKESRT